MEEAIAKAQVLTEALEYIQRFRNRIVVIKCGGSMMDNAQAVAAMLSDVVFMSTVGIRPVIVHGGGKAINAAMAEAQLEVQFVQGRRYTDQRSLAIVEDVLVHTINDSICSTITSMGAEAMGLHSLSSCVLFGEKLFLSDGDRQRIDIGLVGTVTNVNAPLIKLLCAADTIPVIAPIAISAAGSKLNCNADTAAGEVAAAIGAEKFVVVSDTHGIRLDPKDPATAVTTADEAQIREMIRTGVIAGGMLPKVEACLRALAGGVQRTHIIDGNYPHALLLEIFTERGVGTLIQK
ncbi:MAG: acetylglutamate kinase [Planctomycetes bacterium]|nr:acetylglutamate kinase [Planctomycetota bacterium]